MCVSLPLSPALLQAGPAYLDNFQNSTWLPLPRRLHLSLGRIPTLGLTSGHLGTKPWHCQHAGFPSPDTALIFAAEQCARLRGRLESARSPDGAFVCAQGAVIYVMSSL